MTKATDLKFCARVGHEKYVCMYVCIKNYVRAAAYSLDCHEGAMINCRLYRTFQSLSVSRTNLSTNLQMTNCPRSGRGQGQVANFRISHPLKYLRNG